VCDCGGVCGEEGCEECSGECGRECGGECCTEYYNECDHQAGNSREPIHLGNGVTATTVSRVAGFLLTAPADQSYEEIVRTIDGYRVPDFPVSL